MWLLTRWEPRLLWHVRLAWWQSQRPRLPCPWRLWPGPHRPDRLRRPLRTQCCRVAWDVKKKKEKKQSQQVSKLDWPQVYCGTDRGTYHSVRNLKHLLKKRVFLLVATTCVNNDDLKVLRLELLYTFGCNHHRVHLCVAANCTQVSTQQWVQAETLVRTHLP